MNKLIAKNTTKKWLLQCQGHFKNICFSCWNKAVKEGEELNKHLTYHAYILYTEHWKWKCILKCKRIRGNGGNLKHY